MNPFSQRGSKQPFRGNFQLLLSSPAMGPEKEVFRVSLHLPLMRFVDKERRVLRRKPTESLCPRPHNEKKKESHEAAEEKLPISTSRTLRTSKQPVKGNFQILLSSPVMDTEKKLLGELGSLIGYRV